MRDSKSLFEAACGLIPGGVNSPVRAFRGVGGEPFFVARGEGARIWDVDGRSYLDFLGSWGPLILGHAAPSVVAAIADAAARGTSYGAPTGLEVEMAEAITAAYPSIELVRLVSSGTEAAMSAIRLARGATGRSILLKFDGCYHGHADSLLVKAAYGGSRRLMSHVAPLGAVYQAGTLSGNPLAVAAGLATLARLRDRDVYRRLDALGAELGRGLGSGAAKAGVPLTVNRVGSMLTGFFCDGPVTDYASAKRSDTKRYARYFHGMLERGVFLAPSQFEAAFVSLAHTDADIALAARAAAEALAAG